MTAPMAFRAARDFLLRTREDYDTAYRDFRWPALDRFNWARDWCDPYAAGNERTALWIVDDEGAEVRLSFAEVAERSSRVAGFLYAHGVERGDRVLLMLPNVAPLWEAMLACIKLGAVIIPATTQLTPDDLRDRFDRGGVRHVITDAAGAPKFDVIDGDYTRSVAGGDAPDQWTRFEDAFDASPEFTPAGETR